MKLALLGVDASTLALAAAPPEGATVVASADLTPAERAALAQAAPGVPGDATWESLLAGGIDAVLVARGESEQARVSQVRRLAAEGVPLVIAHPLSRSALDLYEIELAQRDGRAALVPWLPDRHHPWLERLADLIDDGAAGELGEIEQIICERALADRSPNRVWAWLAHDIDLLRALAGDVNRVLATGPREPSEAALAHLTAHFSAAHGPPIRWSLERAAGEPEGRLLLVGPKARGVLRMPERGDWELTLGATTESFAGWSPAGEVFASLETALAGEAVEPSWTDAVRSVELVEAVERSLRRGKQVELRWDDNPEESNFKSTMTALGCGLLVFGLVAIVAAAVGQKVAEKLGFVWLAARLGEWPWWLLGILILFLILQGLRLVIVDPAAATAGADVSSEVGEAADDDRH
ncbi:MAG: hypothetical protein U0836_12690 [Pirellulales bacterium]